MATYLANGIVRSYLNARSVIPFTFFPFGPFNEILNIPSVKNWYNFPLLINGNDEFYVQIYWITQDPLLCRGGVDDIAISASD